MLENTDFSALYLISKKINCGNFLNDEKSVKQSVTLQFLHYAFVLSGLQNYQILKTPQRDVYLSHRATTVPV